MRFFSWEFLVWGSWGKQDMFPAYVLRGEKSIKICIIWWVCCTDQAIKLYWTDDRVMNSTGVLTHGHSYERLQRGCIWEVLKDKSLSVEQSMGEGEFQEEVTAQDKVLKRTRCSQLESSGWSHRVSDPVWKNHPSIPKSEKHDQSSLVYLLSIDSGREFSFV